MIRYSYVLAVYLLISFLITGCGKCPCIDSFGKAPAFIGFSINETDTFIIRRYGKGSNFQLLQDTLLADNSVINFQVRNDTIASSSHFSNVNLLSNYDYQLVLPALNKVFNITDMLETKEYQPCNSIFNNTKIQCVNGITSYKINGQPVTVSPVENNLYMTR